MKHHHIYFWTLIIFWIIGVCTKWSLPIKIIVIGTSIIVFINSIYQIVTKLKGKYRL